MHLFPRSTTSLLLLLLLSISTTKAAQKHLVKREINYQVFFPEYLKIFCIRDTMRCAIKLGLKMQQ